MNAHTISARGAPLVLLLVLAACAAPATGQSPLASPSASLPPPSDSAVASPSAPPSASLEDVATFDVSVETAPDWPALLDDSLWVLAPDDEDPAVVRLDPESGAEEARISLPGGSCEGIEAGFGSIWACTPDGMARIDAATNTIVATVPFQVPQPYYGRPAVSKDAVWSLSGQIVPTDVVRIDPATNAVTATYPLGIAAQQLTYGLGSLWATVTAEGQLLRIDPANGEITTAATDLVDPYAVTTGAGHVWVALQGRGTDEDPLPRSRTCCVSIRRPARATSSTTACDRSKRRVPTPSTSRTTPPGSRARIRSSCDSIRGQARFGGSSPRTAAAAWS